MWWDDLTPSRSDDDPVAPPVEPAESASLIEDEPLDVGEVARTLPEPGAAEVTLADRGVARGVGDLPVELSAGSGAAVGETVRVEVVDHGMAGRAGVRGFAFRVTGADGDALTPEGGAGLPATLEVDYSGFRDLYGGGYSDRLRVVALPECALADPVPDGCDDRAGVPLPSDNERAEQRLVVELPDLVAVQGAGPSGDADASVTSTTAPAGSAGGAAPDGSAGDDAAPAAGAAGAGVVLAVTAGPEGEGGSFKATSLSMSGDWQVGVGSGEFSWDYELPLRESPAGPTPGLGLSYSSGVVDAMVASRNAQAGPLGLGWGSLANSFIERRYNSCLDDGQSYGDLCWASDNATISLNGHSSELVAVPGSSPQQWRLSADPRWRVEKLLGANNGDNDGEHWKVTTPDGVQYFFGLGEHLESGDFATESTWMVPVVGDDAGEPCNGEPLDWCQQAWRWNLDRVVDTNDNTQTWQYDSETNFYWSTHDDALAQYHKDGWLTTVFYGSRVGAQESASAVVRLMPAFRCSTLQTPDDPQPCGEPAPGSTAAEFPDVPTDLLCDSSGCTVTSPTFFTERRYYRAEMSVGFPQERLVNAYVFTHAFQDPDPVNVDDAKLWLSGIQRTGVHALGSGSLALPATTFEPVSLDNRVDTAGGLSAQPHWRIGSVTDEFGRQVDVTYGQPHPCPDPIPDPPNWDLNTADCFPVRWAPEGDPPGFVIFNKYLATQVEVEDTTGGSPSMVTSYAYGDQVAAGLPNGAWHHDRDEFVPLANQTWSEWRGYQDATVTQANMTTRYRLFRGMDGDRLAGDPFPGPGSRTASVSSLDGTVVNTPDDNWLAGRTLDEVSLRSDGTVERGTVHGYQAVVTADAPGADPIDDARWVAENDTVARLRTPDAGEVFARQRTQTVYNPVLLFPEQAIEHGWTDEAGDERCTVTGYVSDTMTWMIDFPSSVTRYANTSCSGTQVTRSETAYDNQAVGAAPVYPGGNPTTSRAKVTASPDVWATTTTTFDPLGRPLVVTDPNGHATTTVYSPATGHPASVEVTNHLGHVQHTDMIAGWGVPEAVTDPNGNTTAYFYDPLGRVTQVFQPTEIGASDPSWAFSYDIDPDRDEPPVIRTRQLQDNAGAGGTERYLDTWVVYDSLLRERQTHTLSPASGKVIVADTAYNNAGLVAETSLPEAVTGTAGSGILAIPSGGWANRNVTVYDAVGRPFWEIFWNRSGPGGAQAVERNVFTTYTHESAEVTPLDAAAEPAGTQTLTLVDAYERTTRVEEHDGTAYRPTVYGYDPADRLATVTDPADNTIAYGYDMAGRRVAMDDPDAGDWTYGYDPAGNQTSVTDATGAVTHTLYDELNRPIERRETTTGGTLLASWVYDATGELGLLDSSTRHDATGDWTVDVAGYDTRNRPTGRTWTVPAGITGLAGGYAVTYGYDLADHQTSIAYPAVGGLAAVTTVFNSIGLPETMAGTDSYVYTAAYDDRARPFLFGFGTSGSAAMGKLWGYDTNQRLSVMQAAATGGALVQDRTIGYDHAGNITERNTTLAGATARECFGYDQRQRLTTAFTTSGNCGSGTPGTGANPYNHTYSYTHDGNLDARTEGPTTTDYTYPAPGAGSTRPHAPTDVGDDTYSWDANGNLESRTVDSQTETLTWDPEHRLSAIDDPDGDSSFVYDADGARLLRQDPDGATLYIEGHEITAPTTGSTTAVRSYTFAGSLIATRTASGVDYLATDNQGSVEATIPAGSTTADVTRTYNPYGETRTGAQLDSDRAWIGQIEDDASSLAYLNARYYDPTTGIFTAPDPLANLGNPKGLNPYSYSLNNPTTNSDPLGDYPCCSDSGRLIPPLPPPELQQWFEAEEETVRHESRDLALSVFDPDSYPTIDQDLADDYFHGQINPCMFALGNYNSAGCEEARKYLLANTSAGFSEALAVYWAAAYESQRDMGVAEEVLFAILAPILIIQYGSPARTAPAGPGPQGGESPAAARGRQVHQTWNYGPGFEREFRLPSGRQVDAINFEAREIIELKPNNPRATRLGQRQLELYIDELNQAYPGESWTGRVETYNP